jgi:hypothetical protein
VSVLAHCANCHRELLLDQLTRPVDGFRCPFCGFAFAPSYATVAPALVERILAAHEALVKGLAELQSMSGERLLVERDGLVADVRAAVGEPTRAA